MKTIIICAIIGVLVGFFSKSIPVAIITSVVFIIVAVIISKNSKRNIDEIVKENSLDNQDYQPKINPKFLNVQYSYDKKMLLALLSENDEFHKFIHKNNCFRFIFDNEFSKYYAQNNGKIKIRSYLFSFEELPCKITEKTKYIVRIYFDEKARVYVIYNINTYIGYYITCEKDESCKFSYEIAGDIQINLVGVLDGTHAASDFVKLDENLLFFCTK